MIVFSCEYDPVFDLKPVEQFGFVDLKDAFVNHVVPSQIAETDEDYNGIEDPASILGKPADVFDALRMQSEIMSKASSYNKDEGSYNKESDS